MPFSSSTATISKCPNCGPEHKEKVLTDPEYGEIICGNCGMVISERIEDIAHPESRAYSLEETNKRARTGTPYSLALHDIGLSTIIGKENKDAWTLACFCLPLETYHIRLSSITIIVYNI